MGIVALARITTVARTALEVATRADSWLAAILVGSACADLVSLHLEAQGHPWGALPILQIIACSVMMLISLVDKP
jgi:hypothetical protein